MIIDTLDNINTYKTLSMDIYEGLKFIKHVEPEITQGTYEVSKNVIAIVSEYKTISHYEKGYESHRNVIDIQYPVIGLERVYWSPIDGMSVNIDYDKVNDRIFYKNPNQQGTHVDIGNNIFAIMFEQDGHSPQHCIESSEKIKKITIKVKY